MMYSPMKNLSFIAILSIAFSSFAYSADIARTLRTNADENSVPENFFEIGIGASAGIGSSVTDEDAKGAGLYLNLSGSYNWKGFFIDVFAETSEPVVIGYNAYNNDTWSFDVLLGPTTRGISEDFDERFTGLNNRDSSTMLSGRLTGYFGKNILQTSLQYDVKGRSKGTRLSVKLGRNWQVRNWNFHSLAGLTLIDAKFNDYYLGVSDEEAARTDFEAYDGKASLHFSSSVGVTYPISENWVFRATAYAGSNFGFNDSPLFEKRRKFYTSISTSISYVF